jgi:hypothetical protein
MNPRDARVVNSARVVASRWRSRREELRATLLDVDGEVRRNRSEG